MTEPRENTTVKAFTLYPSDMAIVHRYAARDFEHNDSATIRAMIDFYDAHHREDQ